MNGQHSVYPSEGAVVRGQSKVEKAKYVHTENNLRRTLENISESFKRTNKRLSEQTETVRSELHRLRQNIETVRQEKQERKTGEYQNKRRPYKAERFLCDENIVTIRPFSDCCSNVVTHRKPWAKKHSQKHLNPIRLHESKSKNNGDNDFECNKTEQLDTLPEKEKIGQVVQNKLPTIVTSHYNRNEAIAVPEETNIKRITTLHKHPNAKQDFALDHNRLEVPKIPICDLMDIQACREYRRTNFIQRKPYFLPPLDKINEG